MAQFALPFQKVNCYKRYINLTSKVPKRTKYVRAITRALLGWDAGVGSSPDGHWTKGALTTTLGIWLDDFCQRRSLEGGSDERLSLVASGTRAMNAMMKAFYEQDLWLDTSSKNMILNAGHHYLQATSKLAVLNYRLRKNFFPVTPKHHMLYHVIKTISRQGDICSFAFNPLSEFCALDEDFVGRVANISRAVSPRLTCLRVVERYLLFCRGMWNDDHLPRKPSKGKAKRVR